MSEKPETGKQKSNPCCFCGRHHPIIAYITFKQYPTCEPCFNILTHVEWSENTPLLAIREEMKKAQEGSFLENKLE